jgi:hydroxymethylpyrimidine pyrophosphatase-like HAD family hydrolase
MRSPTLADVDRPSVYHLLPAGATKVGAVAAHMRARGYERADCIAIGDSREDLAVSVRVGTFWLVANALERDPTIREAIDQRLATVRITEEGYGPGVYEAVITTLAEAR